MNSLDELKDKLIEIYSQKGDDSKHISKVNLALSNYKGDDWKQFVKINEKSYNRHVFHNSKEFDIILITWAGGNQCKIHNHPDNGCSVRVMHGDVIEKRYDTKTFDQISENHHYIDDILYIDDSQAYHKMCNENKEYCVTLHVYSPGFYVPTFYD
jgi:predicted metal-dependent enzyme (double-stranded beta helix superfamily)